MHLGDLGTEQEFDTFSAQNPLNFGSYIAILSTHEFRARSITVTRLPKRR